MGKWEECKLGEAITLQRGFDLPSHERTAGIVPIFSSSGLSGFHASAMIKAPGVITGRYGTIGKVFFSEADYWPLNTTLFVKDFKKNYPKFVYYLLKSFDFEAYNDKSAVPGINRNHIHEAPIFLPPLPEQRAIATVLSSLDDKIDLLHCQNKTLEAMAETLFRQWFVESEDKQWKETTLDEVITVKGGTTPSTKDPSFWDGDVCWTSPRDLSSHTSVFMFDTERKITEKGLAQIGSGLLPVGTVLLSSRAPIGYLAIIDVPMAINQGYIGIICDKQVSNYFMLLWCRAHMEEIENAGNGSVFQEISKSSFKSLAFHLPPPEILRKFDITITPLFYKVKTNQRQIHILSKLRDTLLPKLMSGEVRISHSKEAA